VVEAAVVGSRPPSAGRFLIAGTAWVAGLFGLLRLSLVQQHVVLPLTRAQGWLATWGDPRANTAVVVTLECSGADAIALVAAAVFAYPAPWQPRLAGTAGGLGLLLTLNTVRIASLSRVAGTEAFEPLHGYVWPTVLMMATALYVAGWMWSRDAAGRRNRTRARWLIWAGTTAAFSCAFAVVSPLVERTTGMARLAVAAASATAGVMNGMGLAASAAGSSLLTAHGPFLITPQCLITPLMPVYVAVALVLTRTWRARLGALALFLPLFGVLAFARLLTLAVPAAFSRSPVILVHGFHQLVLGIVLVLVAAFGGSATAGARARSSRVTAAALAVLFMAAASGGLRAMLEAEAEAMRQWLPHTLTRLTVPEDTQGALLLLPAYQFALVSGLWLAAHGCRRLRRLFLGLALLHVSQAALLAVLGALAWHAFPLPVVLLRAWAVAAPVGVCVALWPRPRAERPTLLSDPTSA
jgi:exosortase/archaeosortase family protein